MGAWKLLTRPARVSSQPVTDLPLESGVVLAFRRADGPYPVLQANLRALRPAATCHVEFIDEAWAKAQWEVLGKELMHEFELRGRPGGAVC